MHQILAVAIGDPKNSRVIEDYRSLFRPNPARPYILGMKAYLETQNTYLGANYTIDYRECYEGDENFTTASDPDLILCMSTPLVQAASDFTNQALNPSLIPVVGVASDPSGFGANVCGVNAQRTQKALNYYDQFSNALGAGKSITLLNRKGNVPSETCKTTILAKHKLTVVDVSPALHADPSKDLTAAVGTVKTDGLLVLPVDLFFGWSDTINSAAAKNNLNVFWPAEEFALRRHYHFGAPQLACGSKMGEQVQYIFDHGSIPPSNQWPKIPHR